MLAEGHDGRQVLPCVFGSGPGAWQPLIGPIGPLCDPTPWVADAVPFVVRSASQFRTAGPFALTSAEYAADLNEVEEIGGAAQHDTDAGAEPYRRLLAEQPCARLQRPRSQVHRRAGA